MERNEGVGRLGHDLATARGRRAFIIEMCRRRQRPGTGSDLAALMQRGPIMQWPDLGQVLGPLQWAITDAVATRLYMPERAAADLDVIVAGESLGEAERRLSEAGWERTGDLAIGGSSWRSLEGAQVDVIVCEEPWCADALAQAQSNRDAQGLPVLPLPYLVLQKLASSRAPDIGDLTRMLGLADDDALARVREAVRRHAPDDVEDLEALIELGKRETGR
jgi:hypothetical protein